MDTIDGMRTFVAAVETGSFTAASDRLGISKKLVSKYVGQLEDRLRTKLLHRTTRQLGLTETGERYYAQCTRVLEQFDALEAGIKGGRAEMSGELRVSAPASFGALYVQPLLMEFQAQHPNISVNTQLSDRYVDMAEEGFDLAIRIGTLSDTSMIARRLATTELWAVAAPDYLAASGTPSHPRDLKGHACVRDTNLRSGSGWPFVIDGVSRRVAVQSTFAVNSATASRDLAIAGKGLALCPDYAVAQDISAGRLARVLADFASLRLDIHAVYLDARYMPPRVRAFIDHLSARFSELESWATFLDA
ncbi:LysR substrate-binding domain-containing protein [Pseudaestuariivita sp.]|uniref:LysR substrate-binding domain-containing protein n=1 Tax=Pseudaestuariivita sp. TaxID=2211669 RepID=UPI004058254C